MSAAEDDKRRKAQRCSMGDAATTTSAAASKKRKAAVAEPLFELLGAVVFPSQQALASCKQAASGAVKAQADEGSETDDTEADEGKSKDASAHPLGNLQAGLYGGADNAYRTFAILDMGGAKVQFVPSLQVQLPEYADIASILTKACERISNLKPAAKRKGAPAEDFVPLGFFEHDGVQKVVGLSEGGAKLLGLLRQGARKVEAVLTQHEVKFETRAFEKLDSVARNMLSALVAHVPDLVSRLDRERNKT